MTKKKSKKCITSWEAINENNIKMDIKTFGEKITVLRQYGMNSNEAFI